MERIILFIILLLLLFSGCSIPQEETYYSHQVQQLEIHQEDKSLTITEPAQIKAFLSYLRLLPRFHMTIPDPTHMAQPGVEIILTYIGGQQKHILQKGAYYLSENHLPFSPIDDELGAELDNLMKEIS